MSSRAQIVPISVGSAPRRSSAGSAKLRKADETIKRLRARNRKERDFGPEEMASIAGPFVVGLMRSNGTNLPSFGDFDPELVWGLGLGLLGRRIASGELGQYLQGAGVGLLACAARRAGEVGHMRSNQGAAAPAPQPVTASRGYDDDDEE